MDVTYHDAALPDVRAQFVEIVENAQSRYWPFPLVIVKGRVVMAGHVDIYGIASLVNQELAA